MIVTPSSISSLTSEGSTSSILLLTWRRSSAPEGGFIAKLPNHGRVLQTSQSIAAREHLQGATQLPQRRARDRAGSLGGRRRLVPVRGPVGRRRIAASYAGRHR